MSAPFITPGLSFLFLSGKKEERGKHKKVYKNMSISCES
jgi:hypothetical protein